MRPQTKPFVVEIRRSGSGRKPDAKPFGELAAEAAAAAAAPSIWAEANRLFDKPADKPAVEEMKKSVSPDIEKTFGPAQAEPAPRPRIFHVEGFQDPVQVLLNAAQTRRGRPRKAATVESDGDADGVRPAAAQRPVKAVQGSAKKDFTPHHDGWDELRRMWSR